MKDVIITILAWIKNHPEIPVTIVSLYEIIVRLFPTFGKAKSIINFIIIIIKFLVPDLVHKNQTNTNDLKNTKVLPTILGSRRVWI